MQSASTDVIAPLVLTPFFPGHASSISTWVQCDSELRSLAPSTPPPLTPKKVLDWRRPGRVAFVYVDPKDLQPVAYGELNPMRNVKHHLWLGHILVRPDRRGGGVGQRFVRALLDHALGPMAASRVSLIVFPDNHAAIRCYERVGFATVGEERHRFGGVGPRYKFLRLEVTPDVDRIGQSR